MTSAAKRRRVAGEPVRRERRELEERVTATLTEQERRHLRSALTKILAELTPDGAALAAGGPATPATTPAEQRSADD